MSTEQTNFYDLDNMIRLPLEVINCISINHAWGYVRISPSGYGFHVKTSEPCSVCKKHSDYKYEAIAEALGWRILFGNKGKKQASKWYRIKNCGVYDEG